VISSFVPDAIYHLAALTHVGDSWERREEYRRVNVVGTAHVLDAAFAVAPSAVTLVVSSSEVYGVVQPRDLPIDEGHAVSPVNPYAQSKVDAERVALLASRERGQHVVVARPFNHLGPGQSSTFVVPALVHRLLDASDSSESEIVVGDLSTRRDFTDVRDVVRAYRLLISMATPGEIYNVASGRDVAIRTIAELLIDDLAPGMRMKIDPALFRPIELPVSRGSYQKLHGATGWEPEIALRTSLRDVINDIVNGRRGSGKLRNAGD
jgi:GDP-4-dehydro-6-deoxy-D-mannose reductase